MTTAPLHECVLRMGTVSESAFFQVAAFNAMIRKERQKRKIDRIAQKAEAAQRFAKGGHWK